LKYRISVAFGRLLVMRGAATGQRGSSSVTSVCIAMIQVTTNKGIKVNPNRTCLRQGFGCQASHSMSVKVFC